MKRRGGGKLKKLVKQVVLEDIQLVVTSEVA
jgi:hypothetical protein